MGFDRGGHLTDRGLRLGSGLDAVLQHEVVDHPVVGRGDHRDAGLSALAAVGFAFVAQRAVFRGNDQRTSGTARNALRLARSGDT